MEKMDRESLLEKIKEAIAEKLGIDNKNDIEENHSIRGDLGADSITAAGLVMDLQKEYDLQIDNPEELEELNTVRQVVDYIMKNLKNYQG